MTTEQALATKMPFGKYKGQTLKQIGEDDPSYLDWLAGLDNLRPPLSEAVSLAVDEFVDDICRAVDDGNDGEDAWRGDEDD